MNQALAIAIPTFAVVLAALWNRSEITGVRSEITTLRSEMNKRFSDMETRLGTRLDKIEADLRVFYHDLGRHEADIETLKHRK